MPRSVPSLPTSWKNSRDRAKKTGKATLVWAGPLNSEKHKKKARQLFLAFFTSSEDYSESEQQPESEYQFVMFGEGFPFSDWSLTLEENGTYGRVIIDNVDTDVTEEK